MERGIIVSPRYSYTNGKTISEAIIRRSDLWFYLTYWDQVSIPQLSRFGAGIMVPGDFEGLEDQSLIINRNIDFTFPQNSTFAGLPGYIPPNPLKEIALCTYKDYEQRDPGKWSLGRPLGETDQTSEEAAPSVRRFEFDLYNLLVTPGPDVSLAEIIDFRYRRKDELLALRDALDSLSRELASSEDIPREKVQIYRDVENAIQDVSRSANESWASSFFLSSWGAIDLGAAVAVTASAIAGQLDIAALISVGQGAIRVFQRPVFSSPNPFQYIHSLPIGSESHDGCEGFPRLEFDDAQHLPDGSYRISTHTQY